MSGRRLRVLSSHDGAHHRDTIHWVCFGATSEHDLEHIGGVESPDTNDRDGAMAILVEDLEGVFKSLRPYDGLGVGLSAKRQC